MGGAPTLDTTLELTNMRKLFNLIRQSVVSLCVRCSTVSTDRELRADAFYIDCESHRH